MADHTARGEVDRGVGKKREAHVLLRWATHALIIGLLLLVPAKKAAKAAGWLPPFGGCPSYPIPTYIPMWSIMDPSNGDHFECFVGAPPVGASTTSVLTPLIPVIVRLHESGGSVIVNDPTQPLRVNPTKNPSLSAFDVTAASPIFATHEYTLGSTKLGTLQWGEMTERASFWNYPGVKADQWSVQLALWPLTPPVTLDVPAESWQQIQGVAGAYGVAQQVLGDFVQKHAKETPEVLPIFLFYNIGAYGQNNSCCAYGDHEPYVANGFTSFYIWASYMDPPFTRTDVLPLSHEVAEFMHDPFLTNLVRSFPAPGSFPLPWNPRYPFTSCAEKLEVGDAVNDRQESAIQMSIDTSLMTYHVQNVATASWFLQASPSFSVNGWYTLKGAIDGEFKGTAPLCVPAG
jgi:hypothetical protein